jgi:hypothetical protein
MTPRTKPAADGKTRQWKEHPAATLDALIEEATVDANDESEQTAGFWGKELPRCLMVAATV